MPAVASRPSPERLFARVGGVILTSALLSRHGFVHGFSTREGGVSEGPFASLDLSHGLGDDEAAVEENRARFFGRLGLAPARAFEASQVHGASIRIVTSVDEAAVVRAEEADALAAFEPGLGVFVRTADCVPVLLAHPESGAVAAVHAGWRGAVAGIVPKTLRILASRLATEPASWVAAIGPHIRVGAFEIGDEVAAAMEEAAPPGATVVSRDFPRPHGDLTALVVAQLRELGLPAEAIDDVGGCTHDEPARFFSHRRDAGRTGRHLSGIVARDRVDAGPEGARPGGRDRGTTREG
jgi:YfiH family protein